MANIANSKYNFICPNPLDYPKHLYVPHIVQKIKVLLYIVQCCHLYIHITYMFNNVLVLFVYGNI